ncbi:MAG: hypothetical protein H8E55_57505 [Pelagibacterales bacterium]|nr:hypothetical protein [Pelagibacterales bacterium]
MYYTAKVKIAIDSPKGVKWNTETYLVNAVSVTHAESLVTEDFANDGIEFEVKSVSASQVIKVIGNTKKI